MIFVSLTYITYVHVLYVAFLSAAPNLAKICVHVGALLYVRVLCKNTIQFRDSFKKGRKWRIINHKADVLRSFTFMLAVSLIMQRHMRLWLLSVSALVWSHHESNKDYRRKLKTAFYEKIIYRQLLHDLE